MSSEWGERLLDLVDGALAVDPADRRAWLDEACDGDGALRAEVEALLAYDDATDLLPVDDHAAADAETALHGAAPQENADGPLRPDARLGDYRIEEQIGAGGMGVVYRAKQLSLNRTVALKVLPTHLRGSAAGLARFRREVEATAQLRHPHIVSVHATGEENGASYYAMELVEGPPLSEVVAQFRIAPIPELRSTPRAPEPPSAEPEASRPLPAWLLTVLSASDSAAGSGADNLSDAKTPGRLGVSYFDAIARLLTGVADGLEYAHQKQIVHRDIKPSNLLLSEEGRLHISDFGLARVLAEPGVTQTGEVVGTPYYMAPEQITAEAGEVDGRTDVYALGATLFELLTLRPPHPGASRDVVLASILGEEPTPPRRLNRRVPRDLETICLKALEKTPEQRYQSAAEMGDDLRRFLSHLPIAARRSGIVARALKWRRRHPAMAVCLLLAGGAAAVAAVLAVRARDATQRLQTAVVERDAVEARAEAIATDLETAQEAVEAAERLEREQLLEKALVAALQGNAQNAHAATHEAEDRGMAPGLVHLLRGQAAIPGGRFKTASRELEKAVELMPDSMAAHSLLAEVHRKRGRWSESQLLLDRLDEFTPTSYLDLILRGRLESGHNTRKGLETLDEAVAANRQSVAARLIRGEVRIKRAASQGDPLVALGALEDLEMARPFLEETPFLYGRFMNAHLVAAAAYESTDRPEEAEAHLQEASGVAAKLEAFDSYQTHRWLGFYYDRVGDDDRAISEWRQIEKKTFSYLTLTLYRAGRIDEALEACQAARQRSSSGLALFWTAFVSAASCETADEFLAACDFETLSSKDPKLAWDCLHTLWCLRGDPERAASAVRAVGISKKLRGITRKRYRFYCGDLSADELLEASDSSRLALGKTHFAIGMLRLAVGDRTSARDHFERSAALRNMTAYHTFQSRALLAQLEREPAWPAWIPAADGSNDSAPPSD